MIWRKTLLALLALLLFVAGCSSSSSGGRMGADALGGFTDEDLRMEAARWSDGNIPSAGKGGAFRDIFFDYDSSAVRIEDHEVIRRNVAILQKDNSLRAEIEGHCDRRGTSEYNLVLGEERAKAVAALMVNFGARPQQISIISYGEEIPLDPRVSEEAFSKNRRVHFAVYRNRKTQKN